MIEKETIEATWHDSQGRVLAVSCYDGAVLVEMFLPELTPSDVTLEVFATCRAKNGLPAGPPTLFHHQRLTPIPVGNGASATCWLPSCLAGPQLLHCYFRVRSHPAGSTDQKG